jgi:hypothetical protein
VSKIVKREDFTDMVELWFTDDEKIGTFQIMQCEEHGNVWHFTDKSGADNCIDCIKDMCEPHIKYEIPGFEFKDLDDKLSKLTIRKQS